MNDRYRIHQQTIKPKTVIIVYDQPKVNVVRHYTRTLVRRVDPDEYSRRFDHVLLDTATLLELTRRLNIQDHMVNSIEISLNRFFSSSSRSLRRIINTESL